MNQDTHAVFPCTAFSFILLCTPATLILTFLNEIEKKKRWRRTFFPEYFRLSPLLKHVRKVVGGFGRKVVLVLV